MNLIQSGNWGSYLGLKQGMGQRPKFRGMHRGGDWIDRRKNLVNIGVKWTIFLIALWLGYKTQNFDQVNTNKVIWTVSGTLVEPRKNAKLFLWFKKPFWWRDHMFLALTTSEQVKN